MNEAANQNTGRRKLIRIDKAPEGFVHHADLLSTEEEELLIQKIQDLPFKHFEMQGYVARRLVYSFGYSYSYQDHNLLQSPSIPNWLLPFRKRCAELACLKAELFEQVLVAKYPEGAAIGWHRDRPEFGPTVLGLSLASPATMRFRRILANHQEIYKVLLNPRSAYIISGLARSAWQHSLAPTESLRYSVTFRALSGAIKL